MGTDLRAPSPSAVVAPVAQGDLVSVLRFRHGGPHRDPAEEVVDRPAVVFTRRGTWSLVSSAGIAHLGPRHVALLDPTRPYRCMHTDSHPQDRTLAVVFRDATRAMLERHPTLLPAEGESTFATASLPASPRLGMISRALAGLSSIPRELRGLAADALGVQLLIALSPRGVRAVPDDDGGARVAAALEHMRRHSGSELRLADIATAAGVDPFRLSRLFRAELHSSPVRELRRLRLERAARLLRATDRSVTDICFATGHGSLSRFVTAFREAYGMPPGTWRRAQERATRAGSGKTARLPRP